MVYSLCIDIYLCERNRCTTKVLWVLKFWEVRCQDFFFSKSQQVERFLIFHAKRHVDLVFFSWVKKRDFFVRVNINFKKPFWRFFEFLMKSVNYKSWFWAKLWLFLNFRLGSFLKEFLKENCDRPSSLFCGCGWMWMWVGDFFVFKSLDNIMIFISCIDVYIQERNRCTIKV